MLTLSYKSEKIPASPIRELAPLAQAAKKRGVKIYHLNIGEPDVPSPKEIRSGFKNFSLKSIPYANSHGEEKLLESLVYYYQSRFGLKDLTVNNFQTTSGSSEGILWAMMTTLNSNDNILVFEPFYANYKSYAVQIGATLSPVTCDIKNGFHLPSEEKIERKINAKTRAILICSPNNPTGTVLTDDELKMILKIAKKRNLWLISDEAYTELIFDGKKQKTILSFSDSSNIIVLGSFSKTYSLCGARLGYILSQNKNVLSACLRLSQARLGAPFFEQVVLGRAISNIKDSYFTKIRKEYQERRDLSVSLLNKIPGVFCPKPEGAFYLLVELPVADTEDFARFLLTDFRDKGETVMIAPAQGFYETANLGKNKIRVAYVINKKNLRRAIELLEIAIKKYGKK